MVRSQIRTMLRKTGATGLRDFERIIALSSTMHTTQRAAAVHFVDEPLNETCNREKGPRDG
jgi:hypothetical protein